MARTTVAQLESKFDLLDAKLDRLIAALEPKAPAKPVKAKAAKPKAVATTGFVFSGDRIGTGSKKLRHSNRKSFIAAHSWAKPGMSTLTLRAAVADGATVNKDWSVAV